MYGRTIFSTSFGSTPFIPANRMRCSWQDNSSKRRLCCGHTPVIDLRTSISWVSETSWKQNEAMKALPYNQCLYLNLQQIYYLFQKLYMQPYSSVSLGFILITLKNITVQRGESLFISTKCKNISPLMTKGNCKLSSTHKSFDAGMARCGTESSSKNVHKSCLSCPIVAQHSCYLVFIHCKGQT